MHSSKSHLCPNVFAVLLAVAGCDANGCYPDANESASASVDTSTGGTAAGTATQGTTTEGTATAGTTTEGITAGATTTQGTTTEGTTTEGTMTRGTATEGTTTSTTESTTSTTAGSTTSGTPDCSDPWDVSEHCTFSGGTLEKCNSCVRFGFVTFDGFNGNLDGLDGADTKCNDLAKNAGTMGAPWLKDKTFKAWLSDSHESAVQRLGNEFQGYYVKVQRTGDNDKVVLVARGWNGLASTLHKSRLNRTEKGGSVSGDQHVWTSTTTEGEFTGDASCSSWSTSDVVEKGGVGKLNSFDAAWTYIGGYQGENGCNLPRHLYCIEVAP